MATNKPKTATTAELLAEDKLVELWSGYPCLYNVLCTGFHEREQRQLALDKIAEKMEMKDEWVKTQLRLLRNLFTRNTKHPGSTQLPSGASKSQRKQEKKRTAFLMKKLKFLLPYVASRPIQTNLPPPTDQVQLTEEQVEVFREYFATFDKEGTGFINTSDLGTVMRKLGENPTEEMLESTVSDIDFPGNGTLDFEEFLNFMERKLQDSTETEDDIKECFRVFDRDGNGFINVSELRNILMTMGEMLNEEEMQALIDEAEVDNDGMINYEEFVGSMFASD